MARGSDITVVVGDDHPLVAEMLARVVEAEDDFRLAARCGDGATTLAAILTHEPHVAVVAVEMPDRRGPEIAAEIVRRRSQTGVLFISASSDPETIYDCVAAGGRGFIGKSADRAAVVAAVRTVARGDTYLPPDVATAVEQGRQRVERRHVLSPQERRILALSAEGRSTAEIAALLYIGQTTVKTHLRHAAEKLGAAGKAATVAEAIRRGLIG